MIKKYYLDKNKNKVLEGKAYWLVIKDVDEEGNIKKEAWINLKEEENDNQ